MNDDTASYFQAHEGAAFLRHASGYLEISGADRAAFLQRQTTNDVRLLQRGYALATVLTSPTAHILDLLWLFEEGEVIVALTLPDRGPATARFLRGRIFFMDRVTVRDASAETAIFELVGPRAPQILERVGEMRWPAAGEVSTGVCAGAPVRAIGGAGLTGLGCLLLAPADHASNIEDALQQAGATPLAAESYEALRIEAGRPGVAGELVEEYTPLEVGLRNVIADNKGCYTGQEVIARQITYDKVARALVGLRAEEPLTSGAQVLVGSRLAGAVTSAAVSPRLGPVGLAVLRRPLPQPGESVTVRAPARAIAATVVELPMIPRPYPSNAYN
jgi:folate-binding protein YgfZ